jgi:hypothetical protein
MRGSQGQVFANKTPPANEFFKRATKRHENAQKADGKAFLFFVSFGAFLWLFNIG